MAAEEPLTSPSPGVGAGARLALASALLFGASTPFAKLLLGSVDPWLLAGLLYLGAGLGLSAVQALRPLSADREVGLSRADLPWLAGAVTAGGVAGPALLMLGLTRTGAATASLLLTLEGVLTAVVAWTVFREATDRRMVAGMALIAAGAAVLAWQGRSDVGGVAGPLLVALACLCWAVDNNLTRKVALADPLRIAQIKGLAAGGVNLALALMVGASLPGPGVAAAAGVVGFLGYGLSLALFILALRRIGTARTGAYFGTAPFVGAVLAVPLLGEALDARLLLAAALMGAGVYLHLTERHEHAHEHEPLEHAHRHVHDEHHRHAHGPGDPPDDDAPHAHRHAHARLRHTHPHFPDAHHQHGH